MSKVPDSEVDSEKIPVKRAICSLSLLQPPGVVKGYQEPSVYC